LDRAPRSRNIGVTVVGWKTVRREPMAPVAAEAIRLPAISREAIPGIRPGLRIGKPPENGSRREGLLPAIARRAAARSGCETGAVNAVAAKA
jgi:hypothetical protein